MSAIDLGLLRRLARAALATGDAYAYCRMLPVVAVDAPDPTEWALGYVKALSRLGLNAAALAFIERFLRPHFGDAPVQSIVDAIAAAPPGRIDWRSRRPRYQANLKALTARDAALAASVESAWAAAHERWELHLCTDGNYQVRATDTDWPPRWLPTIEDHRAAAPARIVVNPPGAIPTPVVFDGLGLGWELLDGLDRTAQGFLGARSAIYCVETDPAALALLFHLHDLRAAIADPRVNWFVGPTAVAALHELLAAEPTWPLTDRVIATPLAPRSADAPDVATVLHTLADARRQRHAELVQSITDRYAGRDAAWWAYRFRVAVTDAGRATGRPLRILGFTSVHTTFLQYSMRDCLRALERLGHQTRLLIEPVPHRVTDAVVAHQALLEFEPDLVLILSRMRDEMRGLIHPSIPAVAWDQDALPWVLDPARKPTLAWNDFLMGVTAIGARRRFDWPAHHCEYCTIAGSTDTYSADPLPDVELAPYRCDMSYVSHAAAPVEELLAQLPDWLPDARQQAVCLAALNRLLPGWLSGGPHPGPIMTAVLGALDAAGETQIKRDDLNRIAQPLHRLGDRVFRHVALGWIADWADATGRSLALWGNGWDKYPRFAKYARGPSANGEELRRIYQASKINLQLTSMGFFHQRALDGLMAGGLVLGRRSDADGMGPILRDLIARLDRHHVTALQDLIALPSAEDRTAITAAIIRCGEDPRQLSPEYIENRRRTAEADFPDERIPEFDDIVFSTRDEFIARAERFLADDALRRTTAARLRSALVAGYSYDARMARMLTFVRDGFQIDAGDLTATSKSRAGASPQAPGLQPVGVSLTPPRAPSPAPAKIAEYQST